MCSLAFSSVSQPCHRFNSETQDTLVFGKANPSPKSSSSSRFTRDSLGVSSLPGQMSRNVNQTIHGKKGRDLDLCSRLIRRNLFTVELRWAGNRPGIHWGRWRRDTVVNVKRSREELKTLFLGAGKMWEVCLSAWFLASTDMRYIRMT